jgi:hypothetical protein
MKRSEKANKKTFAQNYIEYHFWRDALPGASKKRCNVFHFCVTLLNIFFSGKTG